MSFEKIASNLRIPGGGAQFDLPGAPRDGGSQCKVIQYFVEVMSASNATMTLKVDVMHSPTGVVFAVHTLGTASAAIAATPAVLAWDSNPAAIVGEYTRPRFTTGGTGTASDFFIVNVYETRKAF